MFCADVYRSSRNHQIIRLMVILSFVILVCGCPENHANKEEKHDSVLTQSQISDIATKAVSETKLFGRNFKVRFDEDANERWKKKLVSLLKNDAEFRKFYNKDFKGQPYVVGCIVSLPITQGDVNRIEWSPKEEDDYWFIVVNSYTGKVFICSETDEGL